jgi:PST family polysaccharide transporter
MLAFGGHLTGFSIVNYFVRNLDNILIGRYWSALALGLYSRAYSILLAPIGQIVGPITAVANPTLSRLQHDPARYKSFYLKAIRIIAYVTMPLIIALGLLSKEVVLILLGRQWIEAASIFRILAFAAFWQPLSSTVGWLFTSLNQTRRFAIWGLISSPIFVISFLVGLPWGPRGVALCYGIVVWLLVYPCFVFALKYSPVSIGDMITNIYRPFVLSIAAGAAIYLTKTILSTNYSLIRTLCIAPASGVFTLLVCVRLWKAVRRDVADMVAVGRAVVGNR